MSIRKKKGKKKEKKNQWLFREKDAEVTDSTLGSAIGSEIET